MTSVFMTYAATLSVLRDEWGMSATAAGSISTGFQLGYAVSLVFFSSLADRVGARRVLLGSAWLSAVFALAWALWARSYLSGLVLYTLVALSQGGTYTTAIMLFADRYPPERRGAAVGWLIASSSAGYALSLLVSGSALAWAGSPPGSAAGSSSSAWRRRAPCARSPSAGSSACPSRSSSWWAPCTASRPSATRRCSRRRSLRRSVPRTWARPSRCAPPSASAPARSRRSCSAGSST